MRKLLVTLDNTLDEWLKTQPNQNETVRKALALYKGDITTDTIEGMRRAFTAVASQQKELQERFDAQYDQAERLYNRLEEMMNR